MKLLDREEVLCTAAGDSVVLTSHRIRQFNERGDFKSIMLEEVCSVEVRETRISFFATLGVALLIVAAVLRIWELRANTMATHDNTTAWLFWYSLASLGVYWFVRLRTVVVKSGGSHSPLSMMLQISCTVSKELRLSDT